MKLLSIPVSAIVFTAVATFNGALMQAGQLDLLARDLTEPSPLAQEILNAKPYAFLDDAPLEERRTHAVMSRRWLDPTRASGESFTRRGGL